MSEQAANGFAEDRPRPSANRKLMLWFVSAYIETAHVKPRARALAFVEAVSRIAGQEMAVAKLVPLRGSKMSTEERAALMQAAAILEEMTPTLLAKVPAP